MGMFGALALVGNQIGRRRPQVEPSYGEIAQDNPESALKWWPANQVQPNLDTLVQDHGGYSVYKDMAIDPIVHLGINHLTSRVITENYQIVCDDPAIAEFCEEMFRLHLGDRLHNSLVDWLDWAVTCGNCIMEPLWDRDSKGRAYPFELKPKNPDNTKFTCDPYYNITNIMFRQGGQGELVALRRPDKFMLLAFENKKYGPYGRSLLRYAYTPYRWRMTVLKSSIIYAERSAYPVIVAWHPRAMSKPDRDRLMTNLGRMNRKSFMIIRDDVRIDPLRLDSVDPGHFTRQLEHAAREIWSGILGGFLSVGEGSTSASRSAGDHHADNIERNIRRIRRMLQGAISQYLLFDMVRYQFGIERAMATPAHFQFTPEPANEILRLSNFVLELMKIGYVFPDQWMQNTFAMPEGLEYHPINAFAGVLNDQQVSPKEQIRLAAKDPPKQVPSDMSSGMK